MHETANIATIRTVVADDEALARDKLRMLLARIVGFEVVTECANGSETVAAVQDLKPELLLLDIQMPDFDGFEVLGAIETESRPITVFTTAYDQYAIHAFEANAIDYLLKPFDEERLRRALLRVTEKARAKSLAHRTVNRLPDQARSAGSSSPETGRMVIKSEGRFLFVNIEEIDWVQAVGNYVRFHVGKESYLFRGNIGVLSARLDPRLFVRIHRSFIVNVDKIKALQPCTAGEFMAILKNGKELPCSRGYRSDLLQFIGKP